MAEIAHTITAGFLPLLDSVVLILAHEQGFAADEGVALRLVRETSWANIRDRTAVGHFDVAHMLAPMPVAAALGLTALRASIIAPMALGLGGNAVTVSGTLWTKLAAAGAPGTLAAAPVGAALRRVVDSSATGLRFGVVHPYSGHNYELRYWLASSGIHPDHDVEIVVLPPSLMPEAMLAGAIDGYCVGEPWNTVGALAGGRIATVKAAIWQSSPEKVLGVRSDWATANGLVLDGLLRALHRAAVFCADSANHPAIAEMLASTAYLGLPPDIIMRGLSGNLMLAPGVAATVEDFFIPYARAANFPWQSHAVWFYTQMVRWGQVAGSAKNAKRAAESYRPDLYRAALAPLGVPVPAANAKVEGTLSVPTAVGVSSGSLLLGPDGFFDGKIFDPALVDLYIQEQQRDD